MQTYTATIRHHSIASAPVIKITGTLRAAKSAASKRFGGGFLEHEIIIHDDRGWPVARRWLHTRQWSHPVW